MGCRYCHCTNRWRRNYFWYCCSIEIFNPSINIIGVQAEKCSWDEGFYDKGTIVEHYEAPTIADGCAVEIPGNLTFEVVKELVDDIVTVSEGELEVAMKDLLQRGKAVVEGWRISYCCLYFAGKVDSYIKGKK